MKEESRTVIMMKVPFVSLEAMHSEIENEIMNKFQEVYKKNFFPLWESFR